MSIKKNKISTFLRKILDIGANDKYSETDMRYLRVTNIASALGVVYNFIWIVIAFLLSYTPLVFVTNALLGTMFLMVLIFNKKGLCVLASLWLIVSSYLSVILFLYLLGYSSGVAVVFFLIIILPYMTFPRKARNMAHAFSSIACLTLIVVVLFQSSLTPHTEGLESYISQIVNISITAFICFILISSLSTLIDNSEKSLVLERRKSDDLLRNILPENVIKDLKENGKTIPKRYKNVTILFTDFEGFTELVASMSAIKLVNELNEIFGRFDEIMEAFEVEKIETIGDAYMAAAGLERENPNHAKNCIKAAQKMLSFLEERNRSHEIKWNMRVGIHSGPVVAGVVGKNKYAYDLFGDTINTASRIESAGVAGKINISSTTYELMKNDFKCQERGNIFAKGKGELKMYFVN